ncbi:MAG: acyltransferase [Gammaproteobacteria bacterium]
MDRWSLLAFARFLLALIVAMGHLDPIAGIGWVPPLGELGLFEAVLGFLLISGYSIGSSYDKEPQGFLQRRALRIYPVYIGAITLACIATPLPLNAGLAWTVGQNLLFLNQITTDESFIPAAWSLALEVWLYCLTPLLARLRTAQVRALMYLSFAAFCCHEVARTGLHLHYYAGVSYGLNLLVLSWAWLGGLILARDPSTAKRTLRDCALMFFGYELLTITIQALYLRKHHDLASFDAAFYLAHVATLAAVTALFWWIITGRTGGKKNGAMRLLGDISYPFFLVHMPTYALLLNAGVKNSLLLTAGSLVVAYIFYRCLDFYSRSRERRARPTARLVATEIAQGSSP